MEAEARNIYGFFSDSGNFFMFFLSFGDIVLIDLWYWESKN
jgi:hypothetical protein